MLIRTVLTVFFLAAAFAAPTLAEDEGRWARPLGVVELFTSQGCSSCPPADALLAELAEDEDLIALAYHVDYWNYLGWKDTLANEENTARQKAYARMLERKSVYTPQAVLNGRDHVNGADRQALETKLASMRANGNGLDISVDIDRRNDTLFIEIGAGEAAGKANVVLVIFDRRSTVKVESGENAGHTLTYVNSVQSIQPVGIWKGKATVIELPASVVEDWGRQNCAVLLQKMVSDDVPGPILGAALHET